LERIISESAAVRRVVEDFELGQIWITDPNIAPLDEEQFARMKEEFGTTSIPLHAIVDPFTNEELGRFRYDPLMKDTDYVEFLEAGMAAFRKARGE
jgi:hypothetical protein